MKRKYHFSILFYLILFFNQSLSSQQIHIDRFEKDVIKSEQCAASAKMNIFPSAPTQNYDLIYVRCNWQISPDTLFIAGKITSHFRITEETELIHFDASDTLQIDSVLYHDIVLNFEHNANILKIELPALLLSGTIDSITVIYHGSPAATGFGSFQKTTHDTGNNIWTLSEPYGASDWWPCKQTLSDKIDSVDILITTPSQYSCGAPGILVNEITDGDFTTWHWKTKYPIVTYLIGISVSNFEAFEFYAPHNEDSVLFYNLVYPQSLEIAEAGVHAIIPSFQLFTDIYSDYPFLNEKYGHMQFGWGGGMEHQTMSSVSNFNYDLLVHELAHQWFGNKITCASWRDIWLNEGFATYSTWLSYDFSDDPNYYYEAWLSGSRNTIVSKPGGSVWVDDTTTTLRIFDGRLSYYKGAWLLHMLRWELGDDIFFEALKNFITDPELIYDFATTDHLKQHLESVGDTSITEFLNDWFYGQGFPSYHLIWSQFENEIIVSLDQTTSDPSVSFYEMKVPFRLYGDIDSLDIILKHEKKGQLFQFSVPFFVNKIVLDPDIRLLHANDRIVERELLEGALPAIIYPNPANAELFIQIFSMLEDEYTVTIYNNASQIVMSNYYNVDASTALLKIDISSFAPGSYIVSIRNETSDLVEKIIIQ